MGGIWGSVEAFTRYAVPHKTVLACLVLGMPDSKDDWRSLNRRSSGESRLPLQRSVVSLL